LHVAEIANAVGWNYGCEDMSSGCGRYGLLTGAPLWGGQAQESPSVFSGIWGLRVTNNGQRRVLVGNQFDATKAQACANEFWHAKGGEVGKPCPGHDEVLNNLLRIGLGQGDTRVTPLGVALMLSHLGNAYNTKGTLNLPHLFEEVVVVRDGKLLSSPLKPDAQDVTLDREAVSLILAGMQDGVKKGGTGHEACSNAFKKQGECNSMSWIAGKTGTPGSSRSLNNENWKLACAAPKDANGRELVRGAVDKMPGGCAYQSVKWYAALVGDPKKGTNKMQTWRYAIVVAVQRNWMKNGVLPEDNTAAELAMRYFHDHLQPTFGVAKQK
jgi:hypothetical protein